MEQRAQRGRIRVSVVCFGGLRDLLPPGTASNRAEIELPEGSSTADAVAALGGSMRQVHALLVNGVRADPAAPLSDGDELTLMPPFAGGALAGPG